MNAPVITTRDLCLWYGSHQALKNISTDIPENAITALIGPSGCGKSTYLKTLNRMNDLIPEVKITGSVKFRGEDIYATGTEVCELRRRVGMVFQKPNPFPMSIYDNVVYGPRTYGIRKKSELDDIAEQSLRDAAIWDEVRDRLKETRSGFRAGSSRGCVSHGRLPQSRRCCSWTSRQARSTRYPPQK